MSAQAFYSNFLSVTPTIYSHRRRGRLDRWRTCYIALANSLLPHSVAAVNSMRPDPFFVLGQKVTDRQAIGFVMHETGTRMA